MRYKTSILSFQYFCNVIFRDIPLPLPKDGACKGTDTMANNDNKNSVS